MKLQELRQARGHSQSQLAKAAHMSKRSLQTYEQGGRDIDCANINTLLNLCIALGCRMQDIIEDEELKQKFIAVQS